ncbi:MAG: 1-deoxy-D-xylulose-5-phosphate synthase [Oscillospiraceae bacterium]|nr:1-deoxy-D-xylulose-5-phosphate synthase [Oscillospiraceae bacterium]
MLSTLQGHDDLVKLNEQQRIQLCDEIRDFLVCNVSKTGGHLASNLGVVELTVAVETVFDTATDRLVFDVGHQSYVHKLLTGRQADFAALRQFGGIAGFPKPSESDSDAFVAGHASSSVSIALGMARARTLMEKKYSVVALLGDGAATGGMVYEGLNDAAVSGEAMVVILNDNAMSIDHNVGGMASHLSKLRSKEKYLGMKAKYRSFLSHVPGGNWIFRITRNIKDVLRRMLIPTTVFENMGFTYFGPVDGHDTENLITLLRTAKDMDRPVLVHVMTQKGKGYAPAEEHPKLFHGVGKFDPVTGEVPVKKSRTFSDAFGAAMCALANEDPRVCAITAAMPGGTGLLDFKKQFPKRMFDVGIAEEHAMSMAGGLAKQGMVPVLALYSTFLQRAYDMILQDICMLNLHVVLAVDRAGLVGEDGETHHGVFDVGFLRQAPGLQILCPGSAAELQDMLRWAVLEQDGPVAVRYPRGGDGEYTISSWSPAVPVVTHRQGKDCAIVTYGTLVNNALNAAAILNQQGIDTSVIRLTQIKPLPIDDLVSALAGMKHIVIVEEICEGSGIYDAVAWQLRERLPECAFTHIDLGDQYVTHGSMDALYRQHGLDSDSIASHIQEVLAVEN